MEVFDFHFLCWAGFHSKCCMKKIFEVFEFFCFFSNFPVNVSVFLGGKGMVWCYGLQVSRFANAIWLTGF